MAIYHCSLQKIGRADGRSAIAAAAYRSTTLIVDRKTGEACDYTRKEKALAVGIELPAEAPRWAADRAELWNQAEEKENRKNSVLAYEINVALPHELDRDQQIKLMKDYCKTITDTGFACDWAIHAPNKQGDQRNVHGHIMFTTRTFEAGDWSKNKIHMTHEEVTDWTIAHRKNWETCVNGALKELHRQQQDDIAWDRKIYHDEYGVWPQETKHAPPLEKVDCRSLAAQGIDREPTQHQGVIATQMERRGEKPERTSKPRIVEYVTEAWERLEEKCRLIEAKITELEELPEEVIRDRETKAKEPKEGYSIQAILAQFEQEQEFKTAENQKVIDAWKAEKAQVGAPAQQAKPQNAATPQREKTEAENMARLKKTLAATTPQKLAEIKTMLRGLPGLEFEKKIAAEKYAELQKNRPHKIAKSKGLLNIAYVWKADDGKEFGSWKKYAEHQQAIIDRSNEDLAAAKTLAETTARKYKAAAAAAFGFEPRQVIAAIDQVEADRRAAAMRIAPVQRQADQPQQETRRGRSR